MKKHICFLVLFFIAVQVHAVDYALNSSEKNDTLFFESDAKLEFIAGITNDIEGGFSFNIEKPKDSLYGILKVDLNSLKTSIEARDKHMREDYLETDKFQYAYFELLAIENMPEKLVRDSIYSVVGDGYFYLHGVKNKLKPNLTIMVPSEGKNGQIDVTAEFQVLLEDYDIERPKLVLLKVAKQINLQIKFSAFQVETKYPIEIPSSYK